jgi:hypothetical protein
MHGKQPLTPLLNDLERASVRAFWQAGRQIAPEIPLEAGTPYPIEPSSFTLI